MPAATSQEVDPYFAKFYTEGAEYIRPSGNPMDVPTYKGMMLSSDIKWISDELLSIDMIKFVGGGDVSIACYTTRQKFEYKGTMVRTHTFMTSI